MQSKPSPKFNTSALFQHILFITFVASQTAEAIANKQNRILGETHSFIIPISWNDTVHQQGMNWRISIPMVFLTSSWETNHPPHPSTRPPIIYFIWIWPGFPSVQCMFLPCC